jgi:hypothetical protein
MFEAFCVIYYESGYEHSYKEIIKAFLNNQKALDYQKLLNEAREMAQNKILASYKERTKATEKVRKAHGYDWDLIRPIEIKNEEDILAIKKEFSDITGLDLIIHRHIDLNEGDFYIETCPIDLETI